MSSKATQGIVILGMPRSGTTLLRRLLDAHPVICCPPETNLLSAAARFLREETFAGGVAIGVLSGLSFAGIAEQVVVARLRELVFGFLQDICRQSRKKRWAEKTALNIFHLDQIELLGSGSCRFLCLVRHPLDVVCSIKELTDKMAMYVAELHAYIRQHPAPLEAFAHAWVEMHARLRRFVSDHPNDCLMLKYEDLVHSPAGELQRVFDFLGEVADVPAVLSHALQGTESIGLGDWKTYERRAVHTGSVGRWRHLPPSTLHRLVNIIAAELELAGYPPIATAVSSQPEVARRQYELGLLVTHMRSQRSEVSTARGSRACTSILWQPKRSRPYAYGCSP
jgi:protein-tyrosine sulfotransferase